MNVYVPSVLPKSTLTPAGLRHKFMAGLGSLGAEICDDTGQNCYDDGTGESGGGGTIPIGGSGGTATGCAAGSSDPFAQYLCGGGGSYDPSWLGSNPASSTATGTYQSLAGNTIVTMSNGTYLSIGPDGSVVPMTGPPPAGAQGTVSSNQAAAYAQIINTLTQAGVRIAAITSLPAGASLLPNGTIVGAGQSVSSLTNSLFSNPVLLFGILGLVALMAVER